MTKSVGSPTGPLRPANTDFIGEYACRAPLALALERAMECELYVGRELERPVLDVGCGDGVFVEVLFGRNAEVDHGLDPDPLEIERARRRGVFRRLHTSTGDRMPLEDGSIATALSNSTLEHIPDLDPVLRDIFRVLRSGGELCITVPTDKFDRYSALYRLLATLRLHPLAERFRLFYNSFWKHYNFHRPEEWRARLERAGFHVEEVLEYDSRARCTAHDLLVPLAFPAFLVKRRLDRYYVFPPLRRLLVRLLRPLLPRNVRTPVRPGTGGLVFLRARKPATTATT